MRKKNGYTLVEVIVSMVLIVIVMLYLLRTIVVLTNKNNDLLVYEEYTVYTNSLLSSVYKDIDIAYESDNFLGIENYQAQNKILFKDVNKELSFNKSNKSIIYDGVIYQLPDNVEFREVDGKIYDATFGKNTHSYYIIRIFVKVNNRNDEEIKIVYQNKKDEDVEITYDANLTTYGAESGETATFTPSDGNVQTGKFGDKLKLPSVSYDNWTFYGWYTDKKGGTKISSDDIIQESTTYYAHWEPTIEYVMNGGYQGTKCADENGTCSFSGTKLVCYGAKNKYNCDTKTNSTPCKNESFKNTLFPDGDPIVGYTKACYISSNPIKYADGVNVTLSNPSKLGYTFTGWTGSNGNKPETSVTIPANQTNNLKYTANYSLSTYTISYTLNGGSVATANPTSYNVNTAQFTLRNPTKSTYTFAGWTGSNGTTKQTTVTIPQYSTGNKSYTANWTCPSGTEEANNKCRTPLAKTCGSKYLYNGKCYTYTGTESSTSASYTCDSGWTKETASGTYCCSGNNCYTPGECKGGYSSKAVNGPYCWKYRGSSSAYYHCDAGYAKWDTANNTCWRCKIGNTAFNCEPNTWNGSSCTWKEPSFTATANNQDSIYSCGYYNTTTGSKYCPQGYTLSGSTCTRKYTKSGYTATTCPKGQFKQELSSGGTVSGLGYCEFTTTTSALTSSTSTWVESGWEEGKTRWEWTYKAANTSYTTNYYCNSGYTKVNNSTCIKNNSATDPVCEGDTINGKCYKKL